MKRPANCSSCSASPSRSKRRKRKPPDSRLETGRALSRRKENLSHGETEFGEQERASQEAGEEICRPLREAEGHCGRHLARRWRAPDRAPEDGGNPAQRQPDPHPQPVRADGPSRSEEHTSELQSLMRISYDVLLLKKKKH